MTAPVAPAEEPVLAGLHAASAGPVPDATDEAVAREAAMRRLAELVAGGAVVAVCGAGISTESGIPDYRGPSGAALRRHTPMTHQAFVSDPVARQRYWARSHTGWSQIQRAQPNAGHHALARLEAMGLVTGVITQNVDGLHRAAGSRQVVELHGRLDRVTCLGCGAVSTRAELGRRLAAANPGWRARATEVNPDGDVDLPEEVLAGFVMVGCRDCGGTLMPDVVYFGGSVPKERVAACAELVDQARAVLVLGSSLTVYSGRRFVLRAAKAGKPVAIVNDGPTRCDDLADLKLSTPLGPSLTALVAAVAAG